MPSNYYWRARGVVRDLNRLARYPARTRRFIKLARTAGNFLVGNPFTPAGQASWALAAAKIGIVYGGHKAYNYIMSKRRRSESGMATQMYGGSGIDAGATNVVQRSWHQSRSGKKPRKNAKLALRMLKAGQSWAVLRFQRLSAYEGAYDARIDCDATSGNAPNILGHLTMTGTSDVWMPVQLYDLTSLSMTPEAGYTADAACNYGLVLASNGRYYWRPNTCKGVGPDATATYSGARHWWVEQMPSGITSDGRPQITKRCYMPWCDIRLVLYGATTETTRFTVQLVQIKEDMFDPTMMNSAADGASSIIKQQFAERFSQHWNSVLKTKVYNPIASSGVKTESIFRVLSHKTYVVGPDSTTNEDTFQPNVVCKKFYNINRICQYDWAKMFDPAAATGGTPYPAPGAGLALPEKINTNAELDSDVFNQYMRNDTLPVLHPKAKVFLLITADCYNQQNVAGPTGVPANGASKVPCVDVVIRKKVIYDDT